MSNGAEQISTDLREAVAKHLPKLVGDAVVERLQQADCDAAALKVAEKKVAELGGYKNRVEGVERRESSVADREAQVASKERVLHLREELVKLREQHSKERVDELRGVVKDVFANSRFKYKSNDNDYSTQNGISTSHSRVRDIESTD